MGGYKRGLLPCSVCRPLGTTPGVAKSLLKAALLRDPVRACSIDKAIVSYNPQLLPPPGTANPRWGVLRRGSGLPGQSRGRSGPEQTPANRCLLLQSPKPDRGAAGSGHSHTLLLRHSLPPAQHLALQQKAPAIAVLTLYRTPTADPRRHRGMPVHSAM